MAKRAVMSAGSGVRWLAAVLAMTAWAAGQSAVGQNPAGQGAATSGAAGMVSLTLQEALARARANDPEFRNAETEFKIAQLDTVQGRAGLLPRLDYNTTVLYTHGNGSATGRFVGNNGVHEYISQANVHQELSLQNVAEYRRARAAEALARARAEIAARGLVVTVVKNYYGMVIGQRKFATAQLAENEAQRFLDISQKLEKGGEVAHSDVIKAQIQFEQQRRELREAQLESSRSRLELAVLVFPDFNENFTVVDDLQQAAAVPAFAEVERKAGEKNPELRAATAAVEQAGQDVASAFNEFLPSLTLDYFYGIDANHFATYTDGTKNLGYSAAATLQLPVWSWGAGHAKLKQAELRRTQARVELSFAQRQLLANLRTFYHEAEAARAELESLEASSQLAAESLRLTTLRYQAGEATVLEVVDAQNTLTQARNARDDGQVRFRLALASLETLTGSP